MVPGITRLCLILSMVLCLLMILPVTAGYTQIYQGNTVFIGEQGLDITSAMGNDTQIGWWASGAAIATSSPESRMPVTTPSNFYVSPTTFGPYPGSWYRLNAQDKPDGVAFLVADPNLDIRVADTTVNVDVTDKWVPRGDQVSFRIDTNLNQVFLRGSSSSEGITIKVRSPDGGIYSALVDSSGNAHPIENLVVSIPTYETGSIWDTGNSLYPTGTYSIWAECNVNRMKDNYGVTGKTISEETSLLDQDQNPLISVNVPTTSPTAQIATTSTTQKPVTLLTTVITTMPATAQTTVTVPAVTTSLIPVETTPTKSSGFSTVLTLLSVCALTAVVILKKQQ